MKINAQTMLLKEAIENKRRELIHQIRSHTAGLDIGDDEHDSADQVQGMINRDEAAGLLGRLSDTLEQVNRSLDAMASDCYGLCVECSEPISQSRLKAIPWASHCIRCQQLLEDCQVVEIRHPQMYREGTTAA